MADDEEDGIALCTVVTDNKNGTHDDILDEYLGLLQNMPTGDFSLIIQRIYSSQESHCQEHYSSNSRHH